MRFSLGLFRDEDLPFAAALRNRTSAAIARLDHGKATLAALMTALTDIEKASRPASRWRCLLGRLPLTRAACKLDDIFWVSLTMDDSAAAFRETIRQAEKHYNFEGRGSWRKQDDKRSERHWRRPSMQKISTILEVKGSEGQVKFGRLLAKIGL